MFFDKETFGADRLLPMPGRSGDDEGADSPSAGPWARFMAEAPMSEAAKRDVRRLHQERKDYVPGLSSAEKKDRLARISYARFLTDLAGADPGVLPFFQARPHSLYGVGIDAVPAQDAWGLRFPGFQGLGLEPGPGRGMNLDSIRHEEAESYFFHFPDGNASVARLLVRGLVPAAVPGRTADDLVTARVDYSRLDDADAPVRVRLNSTAVRVRHRGDAATAPDVEVTYARGGKLRVVDLLDDRCALLGRQRTERRRIPADDVDPREAPAEAQAELAQGILIAAAVEVEPVLGRGGAGAG